MVFSRCVMLCEMFNAFRVSVVRFFEIGAFGNWTRVYHPMAVITRNTGSETNFRKASWEDLRTVIPQAMAKDQRPLPRWKAADVMPRP
jgi:hypothetical protein